MHFPPFHIEYSISSLTIIRFACVKRNATVRNGSVGRMLDRRSGVLLRRLMLANDAGECLHTTTKGEGLS